MAEEHHVRGTRLDLPLFVLDVEDENLVCMRARDSGGLDIALHTHHVAAAMSKQAREVARMTSDLNYARSVRYSRQQTSKLGRRCGCINRAVVDQAARCWSRLQFR